MNIMHHKMVKFIMQLRRMMQHNIAAAKTVLITIFQLFHCFIGRKLNLIS